MNKIFSRIILSACMCLALGFTACNDDDDNTPVVGPQSSGAYFPNNAQDDYDVELGDSSIDLYLLRTDSAETQTIKLEMYDESGFFTAPESVTFEAGKKMAQFTLTFDSNNFEPKDYEVVISVVPEDAYVYGMHEYTFTVGLADSYRWLSIGTCQYNDSFLFDDFYECELQQHAIDKNAFRVVDPYGIAFAAEGITPSPNQSKYVAFQLLAPGQKFYGTTVTMDDLVGYTDINTGYTHATYNDDVCLVFPGRFTSLAAESNWTYNCVKSYQENGMPNVVQLAPYYYMFSAGGWNYTQNNDMIRIIFPGGRLMDASGEVEIKSVDIPEDGETVTVTCDVTIGADVSEARVGIVEGNDGETGNFLITHDRAEYKTITSSGEVVLTMPKSNAPGQYSVIVSTYVAGKATEYNLAMFNYDPNAGKEWTLVGTGTYTYAQFWEGDDPGLEMYESTVNEGLYKITNWGGGTDFYFTLDERNAVTVNNQFTGYVHSTYGDVYVDDFVDYANSVSNGISYYDSKSQTFHFNVVYYVQAGVFGYGYETFTLDAQGEEPESAPARMPAKAHSVKRPLLNMTLPQLKQNGILDKVTLLDK